MENPSQNKRFSKISAVIDIEKLERESMKFIYIGLVLGVFIHLLAGQYISYKSIEIAETREKDVQYIKVDFITLPPSAKNPYENWNRVFTKRSYIGKIFRIALPGDKIIYKVLDTSVDSPPDMEFHDIEQAKQYALKMQTEFLDTLISKLDPVYMDIESYYKYRELIISREPGDHFSLLEEMITLDDIDDLGMYKGFVIQDPTDKQNIRGFFHIPRYFLDMRLNPHTSYNLVNAVNGLSEAFNYYTGLELIIDKPTLIYSPHLIQYPVVYITTETIHAFEISDYMVRSFGDYLRNGGLAIIDNGRPWIEWSPAKASLLNLLLKAFGNNIELKKIPRSHPLYYCFFEFDSFIPEGAENNQRPDLMFKMKKNKLGETVPDIPDWGRLLHNKQLNELRLHISEYPSALWGVWADERLVAIYSDKGYGHLWQKGIINNKSRDFNSNSKEKYNFNPQLKLGVNMLVYALTQRGGIAKQLIDYSSQE
ncbi:DUF4159 domain-containing protein [Candidatus Latescibacterota bacterium]